MPRSTQPINVIQESTDYGQFKFLSGNRELNVAHINSIKKSILDNGNFLTNSPIIVNDNMEIIDGQHRFVAIKELGFAIFYIVSPQASLKESRAMNILAKNWQPVDFAKSYIESGLDVYSKYLKLRDEFQVGHRTIMVYSNGAEGKSLPSFFREGRYEIPNFAKTKYWLGHLKSIHNTAVTFSTESAPARALLKVLQNEDYDPERMLSQVQKRPSFLRSYSDTESQLRQLETLYNKDFHYRVRLY